MATTTKRIIVGITGASGGIYATRLVALLAEAGVETHVVLSTYGRQVLADELSIENPTAESLAGPHAANVVMHNFKDVGSTLASGSFLTDGMVIIPASSNTMAAVAAGLGDNLILRAAHVTLKERRPLVLVPRESPLTQIEIENMLRISRAGGTLCPASPGFYMRPEQVSDLVDFVVGKVLDLFAVPHALNTRWEMQRPPQ